MRGRATLLTCSHSSGVRKPWYRKALRVEARHQWVGLCAAPIDARAPRLPRDGLYPPRRLEAAARHLALPARQPVVVSLRRRAADAQHGGGAEQKGEQQRQSSERRRRRGASRAAGAASRPHDVKIFS